MFQDEKLEFFFKNDMIIMINNQYCCIMIFKSKYRSQILFKYLCRSQQLSPVIPFASFWQTYFLWKRFSSETIYEYDSASITNIIPKST